MVNVNNFLKDAMTQLKRKLSGISLSVVIVLGVLGWAANAEAATTEIGIGSRQGQLVFEPATVMIQSGDTLKWINNLTTDSACNVVFERAGFTRIPTAVDEDQEGFDENLFDYLSHKSLVEAPKEAFEKVFNVPPGEYTYSCTPHQNAGMVGKVIVASKR